MTPESKRIVHLTVYCGKSLSLAGSTIDISGPVKTFRWPHALSAQNSVVVPQEQVQNVLDIPHGDGKDHAEGMTLTSAGDWRMSVVIVYDSPAQNRLHGDGSIDADIFSIPT